MSFGQELKDFVSSYKDVSETIDKGREDRARTRYYNAQAGSWERGEQDKSKDPAGYGTRQFNRDPKDLEPGDAGFQPPDPWEDWRHNEDDDKGDKKDDTPKEDKVAVNEGNKGSPGVADMSLAPGTAAVPLRVASAGPALTPGQLMQQQQALPLAGVVASQQGLYQPPGAVDDTQTGYG